MHNDPYSIYLKMGRPAQLTKVRAEVLNSMSSGCAELTEMIEIASDDSFKRNFPLHEDEVYLICLEKV